LDLNKEKGGENAATRRLTCSERGEEPHSQKVHQEKESALSGKTETPAGEKKSYSALNHISEKEERRL